MQGTHNRSKQAKTLHKVILYNIETMPSREDHGRMANFKFNNKHEVSVIKLFSDLYNLNKGFIAANIFYIISIIFYII